MYLAHVGSFVPCGKAVVGLVDRIFTRITSSESVSIPQSTFTIDLTQVATMLQNATKRSLCLVDEFGKGTSPIGAERSHRVRCERENRVNGLVANRWHFIAHRSDEIFLSQTMHGLRRAPPYRDFRHHISRFGERMQHNNT